MPDDDNDKDKGKADPIKLGPPQEIQTETSINIPIKYTLKPPIGIDLKRDYAEYHS